MNLYIVKAKEIKGVGFGYVLVSEQGEGMASCLSKSENRASVKRAMLRQCPLITRKGWVDKFGFFKILFLGDDETTKEQLEAGNREFYSCQDSEGETCESI